MTSHWNASEFQDKAFSFFTEEIYINVTVEYNIKPSYILAQEII